MALDPSTEFFGKINAPDASYPFGSARNVTAPGDGLGTPFLDTLVNDVFGMQQALLTAAAITPSGSPDTALVSDYLNAMRTLFTPETTLHVLGTDAAAAEHTGIAVGHRIITNYYDSTQLLGSGAAFSFTNVTTIGKATDWPNADGFFYDVDGKQFIIIGVILNALAFGARNDDSDVDALAALVIAEAFAGGTSRALYVPGGKYRTTGQWEIISCNHVFGDGRSITLIKASAGAYAVKVTSKDCKIAGFGVCNSFGGGIQFTESHRSNFNDLLVSPFTQGPNFHNKGCLESEFEDCITTTNGAQPWSTSEDFVQVPADLTLQDGFFADLNVAGTVGSNACTYVHCIASGMVKKGFKSIGRAGTVTDNYGAITGCTFEGNTEYNIFLQTLGHLVISGTHTEGAALKDLWMEDVARCVFTDFTGVAVIDGDNTQSTNAETSENVFIGGHIKSGSIIGAGAWRTKFISTYIPEDVPILNPHTLLIGCPRSRSNQKILVAGSINETSHSSLNTNNLFDRWIGNTILDGYTEVGGAVFARATANPFSGVNWARVTSSGTSAEEGMEVANLVKAQISLGEYISVIAWVSKSAAYTGDIMIRGTLGATVRTARIDSTDFPDDEWFRIASTFRSSQRQATYTFEILMPDSPAAGEFIDIDSCYVARGEGSYGHSDKNSNIVDEMIIDVHRVMYGSAAPTSGNFLIGDVVLDEAPTTGGVFAYVCVTTGAPGTWVEVLLSSPTSTTTALADITDDVNTKLGKVAGYMVFNTTTGKPAWSVGSADGSVWNNADGSTAHTPV